MHFKELATLEMCLRTHRDAPAGAEPLLMLSSDCWHITLHDPTLKGFASPGAAGKPLKGSWMTMPVAGAAPRAQCFVLQ